MRYTGDDMVSSLPFPGVVLLLPVLSCMCLVGVAVVPSYWDYAPVRYTPFLWYISCVTVVLVWFLVGSVGVAAVGVADHHLSTSSFELLVMVFLPLFVVPLTTAPLPCDHHLSTYFELLVMVFLLLFVVPLTTAPPPGDHHFSTSLLLMVLCTKSYPSRLALGQ